ncbi:MAG: hypothetical protein UEP57_07565 [Oscillospiraceae bacterium]|nr:hypothetical protein [Oscillospiraceae bacterium]
MDQKKSMYFDYKIAQKTMRELQAAKANVDRLLNMEVTKSEDAINHNYQQCNYILT